MCGYFSPPVCLYTYILTQQSLHNLTMLTTELTEKLIELVRLNVELYDAKSPFHKDAQRLHNIWSSIAKEMGDEKMNGEYWTVNIYVYIQNRIFFYYTQLLGVK